MTTPRRCLITVLALLVMITTMQGGQKSAAMMKDARWIDLDRDGLDDGFEQELLVKFAPSFFLSRNECDIMPAEFKPYIAEPEAIARNGTIYGQVSKRRLTQPRVFIEIHYYHLWSRDCGRRGHPLDVEHVAALVSADSLRAPVKDWRALYWYSSAHEDTVCDVSSGASAIKLDAEDRGPEVWISSGKHASYLSYDQCSGGCGADRCESMVSLLPLKLINIGEVDAPMNGALWVRSRKWSLPSKFVTDFDDAVLTRLMDSKTAGPVRLKPHLRRTQAVLSNSDSTANALESSGRHTGGAVFLAGDRTGRAVDTSNHSTGAALITAGKNTGQALDTSSRAVGKSLQKTVTGVRRLFRSQ